jgi:hypothetical protein
MPLTDRRTVRVDLSHGAGVSFVAISELQGRT